MQTANSPEQLIVDPFLRQKRTLNWNQDIIDRQVGLVLGVGGVGSTVAMNLVRLGFRKVILVDRDVVDDHNLNRQVLYSREHVGKSKVMSAVEGLAGHNIHSEIVPVHMDAVIEWGRIVELARESTCIFNGIDYGDYWDYAVASLAYKLRIPHVLGGTDPIAGHTLSVDFTKAEGGPCWGCLAELPRTEILRQLTPDLIGTYSSLSDIIPQDDLYKNGGSVCYSCVSGANLMVSLMVQHLLGFEQKTGIVPPNRLIYYMMTYEIEKWNLPRNPHCLICGDGQIEGEAEQDN